MNARDLINQRKRDTKTAFVQQRIQESRKVYDRSVVGGRAVGRNPSTGEWVIDTGNGNYRKAKSLASSDITGKSVKITINGAIGQIAEMPGFL